MVRSRNVWVQTRAMDFPVVFFDFSQRVMTSSPTTNVNEDDFVVGESFERDSELKNAANEAYSELGGL